MVADSIKRSKSRRPWLEGNRNGLWKGGRSIASNGYVLIRVGVDHHLSDVRGYAYEHRMIAESKIGRWLEKHEIVHHIDGNRQNNLPENIEVVSSVAHHLVKHRLRDLGKRLPGEPNPIVDCACGCGNAFPKYDTSNRPRKYISGHNARVKREFPVVSR